MMYILTLSLVRILPGMDSALARILKKAYLRVIPVLAEGFTLLMVVSGLVIKQMSP